MDPLNLPYMLESVSTLDPARYVKCLEQPNWIQQNLYDIQYVS